MERLNSINQNLH